MTWWESDVVAICVAPIETALCTACHAVIGPWAAARSPARAANALWLGARFQRTF